MKREMLKERIELLEIGEVLGYPRLRYGPRKPDGTARSIRAGKANWEMFARSAHTSRIPPVLRNGRILRNAGVVPFNPLGSHIAPVPIPPEIKVALQPDSSVTPKAPSSNAERQRRYRERKAVKA